MTDEELLRLNKRIARGKAWIEDLKAQGRYWDPDTRENISLWMDLVHLFLEECNKRVVVLPKVERKESQALIELREREKENERRKELARAKRQWKSNYPT